MAPTGQTRRGRTARPGVTLGQIDRSVVVHLGGLVHLGGRAVLPVAWADLGGPGLYPVLRSVLEVAPADATGAAPTLLRLADAPERRSRGRPALRGAPRWCPPEGTVP